MTSVQTCAPGLRVFCHPLDVAVTTTPRAHLTRYEQQGALGLVLEQCQVPGTDRSTNWLLVKPHGMSPVDPFSCAHRFICEKETISAPTNGRAVVILLLAELLVLQIKRGRIRSQILERQE